MTFSPFSRRPRARVLVVIVGTVLGGCRIDYDLIARNDDRALGGMGFAAGASGRGDGSGGTLEGSGSSDAGGASVASGATGSTETGGTESSGGAGADTGNGGNGGTDTGGTDAGGTGGVGTGGTGAGGVACTSFGPFEAPEQLEGLELTSPYAPSLSEDGATLYMEAQGNSSLDIFVSTRADRGTQFSAAQLLTPLSTDDAEGTPYLTPNGLEIYFFSDRSGTLGGRDLMVAARVSQNEPFGAPSFLSALNTDRNEYLPFLSRDGLELYLTSTRFDGVGALGAADIWVSTRATRQDAFGSPTNVSELNTNGRESSPSLSPDSLTIYFATNRPDGTNDDIYVATRDTLESPFGTPIALTEANSAYSDLDPRLSPDGLELVFSSNRVNGLERHLYRMLRTCTDP